MKNNAFPLLNRERKERKSTFFSFMKSITLVRVVGVMLICAVGILLGCPAGSGGTKYVCENGTPVSGNAPADNITRCESCNDDFALTTAETCSDDLDGDGILNRNDVDDDNDGLIEVHSLTMLHNMRFDLAGTSYKNASDGITNTTGAPTASNKASDHACSGSAVLCGYELTRNLSFDKDNDGSTVTESSGTSTLDGGDTAAPYFVVANGGWEPIGVLNPANNNLNAPFTAIFEGNGYTISHLAIQRDARYIGMFGAIDSGAIIRNVGLIENFAEYSGSSPNAVHVGGLVGDQAEASIINSYTTGQVNAKSSGNNSNIGGLVGSQQSGFIIASYAAGEVNGDSNNSKIVGGLVGYKSNGTIIASYATGTVDGSLGDSDQVGGLVGQNSRGSIIASYATGAVDGSLGDGDRVGGLIGQQEASGSVVASYATGNVDGGDGIDDFVGKLAGVIQGTNTLSYGFGSKSGNEAMSELIEDGVLDGVSTAAALTAMNAGYAWNNTANNTASAWSFGGNKAPRLNYADYDGTNDVYRCDLFPTGKCGTPLPGQ